MIKIVSYITAFKCPYCSRQYESFDDAESCARECVDVQSPIQCNLFACEICKKVFKKDTDASACELHHEDCDDLFYQQYLLKKNFELLAKAANAPGQAKLFEVLKDG